MYVYVFFLEIYENLNELKFKIRRSYVSANSKTMPTPLLLSRRTYFVHILILCLHLAAAITQTRMHA